MNATWGGYHDGRRVTMSIWRRMRRATVWTPWAIAGLLVALGLGVNSRAQARPPAAVALELQSTSAEVDRRLTWLENVKASERLTAIETRLTAVHDDLHDNKTLNQGILVALVAQMLLSGWLGLRKEREQDRKRRGD